jgi:hypothetical protein
MLAIAAIAAPRARASGFPFVSRYPSYSSFLIFNSQFLVMLPDYQSALEIL